MKAYSLDLRKRVISYYNSVKNYRQVGRIFEISIATIHRWVTYGIERCFSKSRNNKYEIDSEWIQTLLKKEPWLSLKSICFQIKNRYGFDISRSTMSRYLKHLGITHKKMRKITKTPKNTVEIKEQFKEEIRDIGLDNVLSFDEVGFQIEMFPRKGWSNKGQRCYYDNKKRGHENWTGAFLISTRGIVKWKLTKEGMNRDRLISYIDELPSLNGKTIVMDNLSVHHNKDVLKKFRTKGVIEKFIPAYSPELNPVEEVFSWLKRGLRQIVIRTGSELKKYVEEKVNELNTRELLNYFKHSYE